MDNVSDTEWPDDFFSPLDDENLHLATHDRDLEFLPQGTRVLEAGVVEGCLQLFLGIGGIHGLRKKLRCEDLDSRGGLVLVAFYYTCTLHLHRALMSDTQSLQDEALLSTLKHISAISSFESDDRILLCLSF
jgi:hypothetical protein